MLPLRPRQRCRGHDVTGASRRGPSRGGEIGAEGPAARGHGAISRIKNAVSAEAAGNSSRNRPSATRVSTAIRF